MKMTLPNWYQTVNPTEYRKVCILRRMMAAVACIGLNERNIRAWLSDIVIEHSVTYTLSKNDMILLNALYKKVYTTLGKHRMQSMEEKPFDSLIDMCKRAIDLFSHEYNNIPITTPTLKDIQDANF